MQREADYIVVGSGSAGAALTWRLAENGAHSVIVVEFGGSDAGPFIRMPGAMSYPMNMARYDWGYRSEPEPHLGGRRLAAPRGKVIGGSSSINGMVYVRGHALDFDHWEASGATGWGYADVLPYFKRMENWSSGGHGGDPAWRGQGGPLHVGRTARENPLVHAFVAAGREAGFELTDDYNGEKQEGFGPMDGTIHRGRRWSAADAYLKPALKRPRTRLIRAFARRVLFDGRRATGVEVELGGQVTTLTARREVILSASAFNSPKLLMLSGLGPADHLRDHGIEVIADRPGIGANLQDHLEVYFQQESTQPITLFKHWSLSGKALVGLQWLLSRTGPGASNQFESAAFVRSGPGVQYPDIQFHFLPFAISYDGKFIADRHGYQAHVGPMRSASRGSVSLRDADPASAPVIRFNYMSAPGDWSDFRHCIRLAREIFAQPAFDPYRGEEIAPGAAVQDDDALDAFVRDHAESAYHPCGTCRLGAVDDPHAVVDPEGRVIGVEALRVADSSIFPRITNGNLNAPSIMVGERIADFILQKPPLARDNAVPWINPDWQISDR